ncbi:hypothetical protein SDJN03_26927, partial [Cucurbita argyrosperma subsp. sororia]
MAARFLLLLGVLAFLCLSPASFLHGAPVGFDGNPGGGGGGGMVRRPNERVMTKIAAMWGAFEAEPVLEGVRDVLLALQLRAAGDFR